VLRSNPARPLAGTVQRLELLADSVTEERIAQVAFETLPAGISLGEMAEVTLKLPAAQAGPVLPNAAIKQRGEQTGVWVLRDGALQFAPLRLGSAGLDGRVQVREGLQAGDEVIVHSENELAPGRRIVVVESITGRN